MLEEDVLRVAAVDERHLSAFDDRELVLLQELGDLPLLIGIIIILYHVLEIVVEVLGELRVFINPI